MAGAWQWLTGNMPPVIRKENLYCLENLRVLEAEHPGIVA
jgi:hypothetical protein